MCTGGPYSCTKTLNRHKKVGNQSQMLIDYPNFCRLVMNIKCIWKNTKGSNYTAQSVIWGHI